MGRLLFVICLIAAPTAADAQRSSDFDFSIRNIMRGPELYGRAPSNVRWSGDSKWIYFMWVEPGTDWREQPRWFRIRPLAGAKPEKVSPAQFDSVGAYVTAGERSSNGRYIAVEYDGDIYVTDTKTGTTRPRDAPQATAFMSLSEGCAHGTREDRCAQGRDHQSGHRRQTERRGRA